MVRGLADSFLNPTTDSRASLSTLNPFINDVEKVSVPSGTGYTLKAVKDMSPEEIQLVKGDILNKYTEYSKQASKFAKDRTVTGGSPLEMVGRNIDKAVKTADQIRKEVGAKMGEIEKANATTQVDLTQTKSLQGFIDNFQNNINKSGYGGKAVVTKDTAQFIKDLKTLESSPRDVKEILDFTRTWRNKLENMKDKFGDFKENKYDNTQIQNVVRDVESQARNTLADTNEEYKLYVSQYRTLKDLEETANRLTGQDGLYGDSIKGGATAKRAVQSTSDAGARQFLLKLRDITGYDGISDADLALKTMADAGDYQGLSLLGVSHDIKTTLIKNGWNIAKKIITPDEATRVENYVNRTK